MPQRDLDWLSYLALCAAGLVLALTWLGPRPAEGLGTLNALLFWTAHVVPALGLLGGAQLAIARNAYVQRLPGVVQVGLAGLLGALLFTPVALLIDAAFAAPVSADDGSQALPLTLLQEFAQLGVPVLLAWLLINAPSLIRLEGPAQDAAPARTTEEDETASAASSDPAEAFWDRVPPRLGRSLIALSAELHYLRVCTTEGDALILFPFGRAVELLEHAKGMQVHRSHWVAIDQVLEMVTGDGRMSLKMRGGLEIPVSRSYRSAVRAALTTARGA